MNIDAVTLDEVRRQAETTRAEIAEVKTTLQNIGIKKVQRGVVTPTNGNEIVVTVSAFDTNKSMLSLLSVGGASMYDRNTTTNISIRIINGTSIGVTAASVHESFGNKYHPVSWELVEFK